MKVLIYLKEFFQNSKLLIVGLIFGLNSFLFGNWVVRIPDVKIHIGLDDYELGLALLGAPVGAIVILPFVGYIIDRFRLGKVLFLSSFLHSVSLIPLAFSENFWQLFISLVFFGITNATMDVSMNSVAVLVEKESKRSIMSTCHGMWSLGAMIGSVSASFFLLIGFEHNYHLMIISVVVASFFLLKNRSLSFYKDENITNAKVFSVPNVKLLVLAFMAFCIMISEGAIADWSALYMIEVVKSPAFFVGLSYASYSLIMAMGRFSGDALFPVLGKKRIAIIGGLLGAFGLGSTLLVSNHLYAIVGFGITGLGFSCIIPVIFSSAANEPGYTKGAGIGSVTVIGYFGFLAGPPFIGYLSETFSLTFGLGLVVLLSLMVSAIANFIRFR